MFGISWQWWVYAGLMCVILAISYVNRLEPGSHSNLAALFVLMFVAVRAIVKWIERRQAERARRCA